MNAEGLGVYLPYVCISNNHVHTLTIYSTGTLCTIQKPTYTYTFGMNYFLANNYLSEPLSITFRQAQLIKGTVGTTTWNMFSFELPTVDQRRIGNIYASDIHETMSLELFLDFERFDKCTSSVVKFMACAIPKLVSCSSVVPTFRHFQSTEITNESTVRVLALVSYTKTKDVTEI